MFALFGEDAEVELKSTARIFKDDSCFLSTLVVEEKGFKSTPAVRTFDKDKYLTIDDIYDDVHPLVFVTKVQSHDSDNPTYRIILP